MEMRGVWCLLVLVSCLVLCVFSQTPSCTPDDFTAEYTQCTPNGLHSLVYYKKQGHVCTGDAPDAVYNIPCNISCHPGSYLPLGASACTQCDAGTFSIGGAQVWEDWESFPTGWGEFSTYCGLYSDPTTPGYCSNTWQLQGTYVSVTGLGRNQASILQLTVSMVTDGHIKFSYRADSDIGGEGFIFKMDGAIVYESDQQSPVFTDFIIYFGTGVHTFQFIYQCVGGLFGSNCAAGTAAINYLELAGLTYAVNNCTQCAPGYFATGQGNTECTICPVNSFSPGFGASSCTACPAGQYSYAGASGCLSRVPCTASDTQVLLGACKSGSAVATTTFLEPMICDSTSYPLPGVHNVACTCNPGTYSTSSGCADCPLGYVNDGTHATCTPCPVGSAAVRMLNHTGLFNQFDPYEQTWCTGECGTNGWRLRGDHLDSGVGHGDRVSVYYQQNVTIEYEGYIAFFFSFQCNEPCTLTFVDVGYDYSTVLSSDVYGNGGNILFSPPQTLALGSHSFLWYFSQDLDPLNTPDAIERADMVSISEINIIGTTIGGASDCIPCGDGYYAEGSSICTACPAGQGSTADHAQCVACTGNTISRGADTCHACGNNTQANFAQTDCTNTCEFVFNGRNYDIHNLAQWGPLTLDTGVYTYAISPCSRYSMPSACNDGNGNVLTTYACQIVDGSNYGWDIGWNAGFSPYVNDGAVGVRAEFNLGDPAGCDQGRRATVNVTCDGSSFFESLEGGVEIEPCHYAFTFKSAYACPICSEQDYTYYYTLCENGQRQQIFYWNEPQNCHDGVNLPLPATVDCSDSTHVCQAGTYLGADGQSCVACPAGEFSLGGGELIQNWEFLPSGFFSICNSNPCTLWENNDFSDETTITSGFGDSSLVADLTFKRSGTLSFDYKVYSPANGTFKFLVDGVQQISVAAGANIITWTPFSVNVNAGTHDFRWQFTDGLLNSPSLLAFQAATLTNMVILGLDYHDDTCTPCPVGTRSAYANESGVIGCVTCPYNTQAYTQGLDYCTPCDSDQYAFPGSQSCGPASYCSTSDYITVYTPCAADGTRTATQVLKPPVICQEITPPPAPQTVGCAPCPPFTTRSGANCVGCPAGQYYSLSTGVCVANTPGNVVQRSVSYFIDNSTFSWPAGWSTGCSGLCLTPGWRILGSSIDSGYHAFYSEIDSYVQLNVTLDVVGSISFTYSLTSTDSSGSGLQLLLDGVAYPLAVADGSVPNQYLNASIALSAGNHLLLWNYHQGTGTGTATLQNVVVVGQQGALGASEPVACSPGQFSSDPTDTACSLCAAGSYASGNASVNCTSCGVNTYNLDLGASSCTPCENGSFTNQPGSIVCQTTCSFQIGSYTYNLPFNTTVSVFDATHNRYDINVCGFANQCSNSHVCLTSSSGGVSSVGSTFQFVPNPDNTTSTSQPFSIYFEHGAAQACNDDGSSSHTSTIIDFQCDTYSADIKTSVPTFAAVDGCTSRFLWQTIYACPVCTDADYKTTTGVCSGGKRQIQKTRQTSCNGDANIPVPDEKCSSHEFPTGAVVAVVVVFVVVVAIAVGIVVRNRYLAKQYSKLLQETHANTDNVSNNRNLSSAVL